MFKMIAVRAPRDLAEKLRDALPQIPFLVEKFNKVVERLGRRLVDLGEWESYRFSLKPLTNEVILYVRHRHGNKFTPAQVEAYQRKYCQGLDTRLEFQPVPASPGKV